MPLPPTCCTLKKTSRECRLLIFVRPMPPSPPRRACTFCPRSPCVASALRQKLLQVLWPTAANRIGKLAILVQHCIYSAASSRTCHTSLDECDSIPICACGSLQRVCSSTDGREQQDWALVIFCLSCCLSLFAVVAVSEVHTVNSTAPVCTQM